jgi:hypothetical protein
MPRIVWLVAAMFAVGLLKHGSPWSHATVTGLSVQPQADHVIFRWSGPIDGALVAGLQTAYEAHKADPRRIVLSLHSPGGRIHDGISVIEQIKLIKKTHTLDTIVDEGSHCASMCVPVFLTGTARTAAARARFMFHEPYLPPRELRELQEQSRELRRQGKISETEFKLMLSSFLTDKFFTDYLERAGLDGRWISKLRREIKGRDLWFTAEQLRKERSGVVDKLV